MRTKLVVSIAMLLFGLGLAGCYTEFATTGDNYGNYGSSYNSAQGYYSGSDSGYVYDSTAVPPVNNYINNYYGYGNPYYGGSLYYSNMFVPDYGWWNSDSWMFGIGIGGWYGGGYPYYGGSPWWGYGSYYSPYYAYSPFYSSYYPYYTPWLPYGYYTSGTGVPARARNMGDTRDGRQNYGTGGGAPQQSVGAVGTGRAYGSNGAAASSVQSTPSTRSRVGGTETPTATGTSSSGDQSRTRVRGSDNATTRQQTPNATPNSQPSNPQPRVRERAPSNPPPQQNSTPNQQPQSNPEPRVRESAPSYSPPPQQNPAPSYNPPPSYTPPPSPAPAPQAPPTRVRHGYVSYNTYWQNYVASHPATPQAVGNYQRVRENQGYTNQVSAERSYQAPRTYQESAPRYEFHSGASFAPRAAAPAAHESSSSSSGEARTRH